MLALSWCSLLGRGTTVEFNFLMHAVFTTLTCKSDGPQNSLNRIWKILHHSLLWAYHGLHPTHDVDGEPVLDSSAGKPLCGDEHNGFFCVLWAIKGDLEYFHDVPYQL